MSAIMIGTKVILTIFVLLLYVRAEQSGDAISSISKDGSLNPMPSEPSIITTTAADETDLKEGAVAVPVADGSDGSDATKSEIDEGQHEVDTDTPENKAVNGDDVKVSSPDIGKIPDSSSTPTEDEDIPPAAADTVYPKESKNPPPGSAITSESESESSDSLSIATNAKDSASAVDTDVEHKDSENSLPVSVITSESESSDSLSIATNTKDSASASVDTVVDHKDSENPLPVSVITSESESSDSLSIATNAKDSASTVDTDVEHKDSENSLPVSVITSDSSKEKVLVPSDGHDNPTQSQGQPMDVDSKDEAASQAGTNLVENRSVDDTASEKEPKSEAAPEENTVDKLDESHPTLNENTEQSRSGTEKLKPEETLPKEDGSSELSPQKTDVVDTAAVTNGLDLDCNTDKQSTSEVPASQSSDCMNKQETEALVKDLVVSDLVDNLDQASKGDNSKDDDSGISKEAATNALDGAEVEIADILTGDDVVDGDTGKADKQSEHERTASENKSELDKKVEPKSESKLDKKVDEIIDTQINPVLDENIKKMNAIGDFFSKPENIAIFVKSLKDIFWNFDKVENKAIQKRDTASVSSSLGGKEADMSVDDDSRGYGNAIPQNIRQFLGRAVVPFLTRNVARLNDLFYNLSSAIASRDGVAHATIRNEAADFVAPIIESVNSKISSSIDESKEETVDKVKEVLQRLKDAVSSLSKDDSKEELADSLRNIIADVWALKSEMASRRLSNKRHTPQWDEFMTHLTKSFNEAKHQTNQEDSDNTKSVVLEVPTVKKLFEDFVGDIFSFALERQAKLVNKIANRMKSPKVKSKIREVLKEKLKRVIKMNAPDDIVSEADSQSLVMNDQTARSTKEDIINQIVKTKLNIIKDREQLVESNGQMSVESSSSERVKILINIMKRVHDIQDSSQKLEKLFTMLRNNDHLVKDVQYPTSRVSAPESNDVVDIETKLENDLQDIKQAVRQITTYGKTLDEMQIKINTESDFRKRIEMVKEKLKVVKAIRNEGIRLNQLRQKMDLDQMTARMEFSKKWQNVGEEEDDKNTQFTSEEKAQYADLLGELNFAALTPEDSDSNVNSISPTVGWLLAIVAIATVALLLGLVLFRRRRSRQNLYRHLPASAETQSKIDPNHASYGTC